MSKTQQPPVVADNHFNPIDEKDEVALLRTRPPRIQISRSNSAPQAQNRFGSHWPSGTPTNPESKLPANKQKRVVEEQNILTLSDGIINVNQEQAAQAAVCVLSSHEALMDHSPWVAHSHSTMSSTLLCDTNHLPPSTKLYNNNTPPFHSRGEDSADLCPTSHKSPADVLRNNQNIPVSQFCEQKNISVPRTEKRNQQLNGVRKNSLPYSLHLSSSPKHVANGTLVKEIELDLKSGHPIRDIKDYHPSSEVILENPDSEDRRQHQHQCRQVQSEIILPNEMQRKMLLANVKEKGYARLEEELMKAQKALERKDEEVDELRGIRERLMKEVSDFTASLFEEVNSQLNEAAISEQQARKQLMEANSKIEVLTAEVAALKDLVLTSTPSSPNKHLHPQIDTSAKKEKGGKPFWKTHRRSTSHHQFTKESREKAEANEHHSHLKELDTGAFDEFQRWRLQPTMEFLGQFFVRVQLEDIQPCLNFKNRVLADKLLESVRSNSLSIEPIPGDQSYPRKCCLSESHKLCNYKIRFEDDDKWYSISQMSRNRIAAVCDFYAYLRYIVQGLVKCPDKDMFAELVRLRNQMAQARLGLI